MSDSTIIDPIHDPVDNLTFKAWLRRTLEESPGLPSSMRLQQLINMLVTVVVPILVWTIMAFVAPEKIVTVFTTPILSFLGALYAGGVAGKVIQYTQEPNASPTATTTPPTQS